MEYLLKHRTITFQLIGIIIILQSCNRPVLPTVSTSDITAITVNSAVSGGNVTDNGGAEVTARGVCWSNSQNPTISSNKTNDGSGNGSFVSNITGLSSSTTYYVRAYATNNEGTGYGNEQSFTSNGIAVQDIDGNYYNTVIIGPQTWMKENLKSTRYNDGSSIPNITDNTSWENLSYGAYCWYDNDQSSYKSTYGALYNWYAVNTGKLCPTGWHVPNENEWSALINYLGGTGIAGGKLKETGTIHWNPPNTGATNESGFSARGSGYRSYGGAFTAIGQTGAWWSATENDASSAGTRGLRSDSQSVDAYINGKIHGFSVRCIKN